jgi:hypothetical protein
VAGSPKEYVESWLQKQGYPLEMVVAQELRRAGFGVTESAYYEDQHSHQPREIDMFASAELRRANSDSDIALIRLTTGLLVASSTCSLGCPHSPLVNFVRAWRIVVPCITSPLT